MLEHRPVVFLQYVAADLYDAIPLNADEVAVEGTVMDLAQGKTIGDKRLTPFDAVRDDVRSVQQLAMAQPAERALLVVGMQDPLAKVTLVHPHLDGGGDVFAARLLGFRRPRGFKLSTMVSWASAITVKHSPCGSSPTINTGQMGRYRPGISPKR